MEISVYGQIPDEKNAQVFRLIENALQKHFTGKSFIIGITGAGGAGKTTLAHNLCMFIGNEQALPIDLDDYLMSRSERGKREITGYNPDANQLGLARKNLENLTRGLAIAKPRYDHGTGEVLPVESIRPKPIIVVEGVTTLYSELQGLYDISFFLDASEETQFKSRLKRDVGKRGYTIEEARKLIEALRPDYKRFIEPTKDSADVICHVNTDYVMTVTRCAERFR